MSDITPNVRQPKPDSFFYPLEIPLLKWVNEIVFLGLQWFYLLNLFDSFCSDLPFAAENVWQKMKGICTSIWKICNFLDTFSFRYEVWEDKKRKVLDKRSSFEEHNYFGGTTHPLKFIISKRPHCILQGVIEQ